MMHLGRFVKMCDRHRQMMVANYGDSLTPILHECACLYYNMTSLLSYCLCTNWLRINLRHNGKDVWCYLKYSDLE